MAVVLIHDSAFRFSEVDQMSIGTRDNFVVKSKLSPRVDYVALRQVNPILKKGL